RQSTSRNSGWSRWWQSTSNSSVLLEPPYAEPHVRWCERAEGVTPHPTRSIAVFHGHAMEPESWS
ncbi:MAG: hypothetical protein KGI54_09835, partial [Pseudomonadota bacterium]|nr:hypothetical protein [Pseudomonadota bacterium]